MTLYSAIFSPGDRYLRLIPHSLAGMYTPWQACTVRCVELTDRSADVRHAVRCRRVGEAAPHTARPHSLAAPRPVRRRQERVQLPVRLLRHLVCSTTRTTHHYHSSEAFIAEYY